MKYIKSLRNSLNKILTENEKAVILGEDIGEPYGGAFKVTKGLENKFPNRIISTPMSESSLTGITTGMALNGYKPILEIMFGDFITLCTDQIINHASKFKFLFNKNLNMVIRTPMGGYRGYGATHSQTLEKIFFGIPNISILAPNILNKPGKLLEKAVNYNEPVLFIENKLDYSKDLIKDNDKYEIFRKEGITTVNITGEKNMDGYLITYGGMVTKAINIMWKVFLEKEKSIKLIILDKISPLENTFIDFISSNKEIYVLEEGVKQGGLNSEISRILLEKNIMIKRFKSFAAKNKVIGASKILEQYVLPNEVEIINTILEV